MDATFSLSLTNNTALASFCVQQVMQEQSKGTHKPCANGLWALHRHVSAYETGRHGILVSTCSQPGYVAV
eukprot:1064392-Pelagomonas_calceolata.AAC.1